MAAGEETVDGFGDGIVGGKPSAGTWSDLLAWLCTATRVGFIARNEYRA
jgi:hypothetical protein